jgi:lipopolysaccharide exporter
VGASAGYASRRWDNLVISALFGPSVLGAYNLAYNLADVPAVQVGEQIADVLLPSFSRLAPERRPFALARAIALLSLLMSPLAIGLGAVAPTLVQALFDDRWSQVGPMLAILSALSVMRPLGAVIWSYLQAAHMPRLVMVLEGSKLVLLMGVLLTLGRLGPLWACAAVGLAFSAHTVASLWVVDRSDKLPLRAIVASIFGPLGACAPMIVAVVGVRHGLARVGLTSAVASVALQVVAGAVAYAPAALLLAPSASRDFLGLVRGLLRRDSGEPAEA